MAIADRYTTKIGGYTIFISRDNDLPILTPLDGVSGTLKFWGDEDRQDKPVIFGALTFSVLGSLELARELSSPWDTDPKPTTPRMYVRLEETSSGRVKWYGRLRASDTAYDPNDPTGVIKLTAVDFMGAAQRDPLTENIGGGDFTVLKDFIEDLYNTVDSVVSLQSWFTAYPESFLLSYGLDITQTTGGYTEQVYDFLKTFRLTLIQREASFIFIDTADLFRTKTFYEFGTGPEETSDTRYPVSAGGGLIRFSDRDNRDVKRGILNGDASRAFLSVPYNNIPPQYREYTADLGGQFKREIRLTGQIAYYHTGNTCTCTLAVYLILVGNSQTWGYQNGQWVTYQPGFTVLKNGKDTNLLPNNWLRVDFEYYDTLPEEGQLSILFTYNPTQPGSLNTTFYEYDYTIQDTTQAPDAGLTIPYSDGIVGKNVIYYRPDPVGAPNTWVKDINIYPPALSSLDWQNLVPYFRERFEGEIDGLWFPGDVIEIYGSQYGIIYADNDLVKCTSVVVGIYNGLAAATTAVLSNHVGEFNADYTGIRIQRIEIETDQQGEFNHYVQGYKVGTILINSFQESEFFGLVTAQLRNRVNIVSYSINQFDHLVTANGETLISSDQQGEFLGEVLAAIAGVAKVETDQQGEFNHTVTVGVSPQAQITTYQLNEFDQTVKAINNKYPLTFSDNAQGWALRKLDPGASAAIEVYRDSDQTTQTIGFSGDELDIGAISSFCAGTTGRVQIIYEQSGSGNNCGQFTASAMPIIFEAGELKRDAFGNVAMYFDGVGSFMEFSFAAMLGGTAERYFYHVGEYISGNGATVSQGNSSSDAYTFSPLSVGDFIKINGNLASSITWASPAGTQPKQTTTIFTGPNIEDHEGREQGVSLTPDFIGGTGTAIDTPTQQGTLGKLAYTGSFTEMYLSELILVFNGF